ncbi:methyl-accepting chemotaxis protein, partial [Campylobacter sp. B0100352/1]|nr:methyl-accepting chemotaxis protein [Campylobacter sp. B0100352/1]
GHSENTYAAVYSPDGEIYFHQYPERILTKNPLSINIANTINTNPNYYLNPKEENALFGAKDDKGNSYEVLCSATINPKFRVCTVTEDETYTGVVKAILFKQILIGIIATII